MHKQTPTYTFLYARSYEKVNSNMKDIRIKVHEATDILKIIILSNY